MKNKIPFRTLDQFTPEEKEIFKKGLEKLNAGSLKIIQSIEKRKDGSSDIYLNKDNERFLGLFCDLQGVSVDYFICNVMINSLNQSKA